jgi:general secretion pathway protein D
MLRADPSGKPPARASTLHVVAAALMCIALVGASVAQEADDNAATSATEETESDDVLHRGTGAFVNTPPAPPAPPPPSPDEPRLDIVFDRAPVGIVVQSLLSDFANASVVIDPRVQGEITIRSQGQLTAQELPEFLRMTIATMGLDLVRQGPNAFVLRPINTPTEGQGAEVYQPGQNVRAGAVIYGLRHVSAREMERLLQPFARQGVTVQPENTRELLILSGPAHEIQSLVSTIEILDVDWLQGVSFGVAPLDYADPEALIGELRTLFGGPEGPIGSMVEFVPLPGRRAIVILAKRPERLDQARNWIAQLDRPLQTGGRIRFLSLTNADAEKVAETIASLFGEENTTTRVTADAGRNALIIQSDPATFEEIAALVREIDRPISQVMIELTIAEVTLNNDFRFGVQWTFDLRDGGRATLSEAENGAIVARFPGFSYGYTSEYVQAALNALSSRTQVEVISSPVIVTLDNQEATLQVGDEVPIVTQSATNVTTPDATVVNTVQYRETGILLRVTPRIGAGDSVTLEVTQEASEVSATTTSGIDSPTIQQRRLESTISIGDGQTVAMGGLIRANRTRGRSGVPYLSAIPLLGAAFRERTETVRRTELIVFLTPRILRSTDDTAAATDDFARRLERIRDSRFVERVRNPD